MIRKKLRANYLVKVHMQAAQVRLMDLHKTILSVLNMPSPAEVHVNLARIKLRR